MHSERDVAADMLDFLHEFLEAHPELAGNDFFVTGESYAVRHRCAPSATSVCPTTIVYSKLTSLGTEKWR